VWIVGNLSQTLGVASLGPIVDLTEDFVENAVEQVASLATMARETVLPILDKSSSILRELREEWVDHHGNAVRIIPTFALQVEE